MQNDRNRRSAASSFQFPGKASPSSIRRKFVLNIDTKTLSVSKYSCCIAHSLTDGYAESEQPFGVLSDDEVAFASVQGRYHGVPSSLAVLNLQR